MKRIFNFQFSIYKKNEGQIMLFTVLVISALFLSVTAIAGLLMNYQLRQVTNIADAAKAVFAADAATERSLFVVFRCNGGSPVVPSIYPGNKLVDSGFCDALAKQVGDDLALPKFFNNATYKLIIETDCGSGTHVSTADISTADCIKAAGQAGKSTRAFGIFF